MPGWKPRHHETRNEKRRMHGRTDKKRNSGGARINAELKTFLRHWIETAENTTIDSIRDLIAEHDIAHSAEQIAKWVSNNRMPVTMEKRRQYENARSEKQLRQRYSSRDNYKRTPTPSAAGMPFTFTEKDVLESYFNTITNSPSISECSAIAVKHGWHHSEYQIQKWFKNRRRRDVDRSRRNATSMQTPNTAAVVDEMPTAMMQGSTLSFLVADNHVDSAYAFHDYRMDENIATVDQTVIEYEPIGDFDDDILRLDGFDPIDMFQF
tara:strand:+ start:29957 stop:30754 length:798 start_codon:yes stop_codon:yes gene_type:complete